MQLNEYQVLAQRTARKEMGNKDRLMIAALGLNGEAGEVADLMKKWFGHGHKIDKAELIKELGDVLWYIAEICEVMGIDIEKVAIKNIDKLKDRYPNGFESDKSINR